MDIRNFAFNPPSVTINVGDTVRWTNNDSVTHTATSGSNCPGGGSMFDSGNLSPGGTFSFTFNAPGTTPYHCNIHCSMTGSVTVVAPDFSVSCSPGNPSGAQGGSASSICTVTSMNGFNSAVTLSASGLPSGVSHSFSPNPVTPPANGTANSTLTLNIGSSVPVGSYPFTVSGTSGSVTRIFSMTLMVTDFGFTISCNPSILAILPAGNSTSVCTVTSQGGFSAAVNMSCGPLAGTGCTFNPNPVTPPSNSSITTELTVSTDGTISAGDYSLTINGNSTDESASFNATVSVRDFTVSSSPSSLIASPGGTATSTTTVGSLNGFNSAVDLSCSGAPSGVTCSFTPSSVTPPPNSSTTSSLTVNVDGTVPEGTYNFDLVATTGAWSKNFGVSLTVTTAQDFSISCNPTSVNVLRNGNVDTICTIASINAFTNPVTFSCSSLPANVNCTFFPNPVTPPSGGTVDSTLTLNVGSNVPLGSYAISVDATDGGSLNHSTQITLNVQPDYKDDFEDGTVTDWTFLKGSWSVINGDLTGTHTRKATALAPFTLCPTCTVEADMKISGGDFAKISLIAWYQDARNLVELLMIPDRNRWILKRKIDGITVSRDKFPSPILTNTVYHVALTYDGTQFAVSIDGVPDVITMSGTPPEPGLIGFRVIKTTGAFEEIFAYR